MRPAALILIAISLFAIIAMADMANATTVLEPFNDLSAWNIMQGNPTVSNNILNLSFNGDRGWIGSKATYTSKIADIEFDYMYTNGAMGSPQCMYGDVNNGYVGGYYVQANQYWLVADHATHNGNSALMTPTPDVWHHVRLMVNGTSGSTLYLDGNQMCTFTGNSALGTSNRLYLKMSYGTTVYIKNYYFDDNANPLPPGNILYVNVTDSSTGGSIIGAMATLYYSNGTVINYGISNATGWASIIVPAALPNGATDITNLTVTAPNYGPAYQTGAWAYATRTGSYSIQMALSPGPVTINGYTYDYTDMSTLAGSTITILYPNGTTMATPTTDNTGYYSATMPANAPAGLYNMTAAHAGFTTTGIFSANYPTAWAGASAYQHDFFIYETIPTGKAQISVNVVNKYTNASIPGATVQTYLTDYSATPTTYTANSLGTVTAIVAQGTYQVKASAGSGYNIASGVLVATGQNTYRIVLQLTPTTTPTPYPAGTFTLAATTVTPTVGATDTMTLTPGTINKANIAAVVYWQSYDQDGQGNPSPTFLQEYYQAGGTWYKGTPSGSHTATTVAEAFAPTFTYATQGIYRLNAMLYSTTINPDGSNLYLGQTNTLTINCGGITTPTPGATVNPSMGPGATIYGGVRVYGSDTGTYVPSCNIQVVSSGGTTAFYQQGIINGRATFFVTQNIVYTIMVDDPTGQYQARAITYVFMNQYDTATVYLYPNPSASPTPTPTPTTSAAVTFTGSVYTKYQNGTLTNLTTLYPGTVATIIIVKGDGSGTVMGSGTTDLTGHYSFTTTITNPQGNDMWGNPLVTMYYENVTAPNFQGSYVVFMAPVTGNARAKNFIIYPSSYGNVNGPNTDFTADVTTGAPPLTVHFTDLSQNDPIAWYWDFGDGGTSTQQNPTHTYTVVGQYNVTLQSKNAYGMGNNEKYGYISTLGHITFQGTVYNYNTNNVVNGALLTAIDSTGQGAATGYSDTNGHYSITATPPFSNVYSLRVSMTGFNGETITGLKYPTYFTNGVITNNIYIYPLSATTPQPCVSPGSPVGWATLSPGDRQSHITNSGNVIAAFAGLFAILIFLGGLAALVGRLRSG